MDIKILIALIAAFVPFIGLLISKEQKTSEFRQAWIDRVRNDVADLIGKCSHIANSWILVESAYKKDKKVGDKFLQDNITILRDMDVTISRIRLSLNPDKDADLMTELENIESVTTSPKTLSELAVVANKMEELSHKMFKTEWERVKTGEPFFRASKWVVGLSIPCLIIWFVVTKI